MLNKICNILNHISCRFKWGLSLRNLLDTGLWRLFKGLGYFYTTVSLEKGHATLKIEPPKTADTLLTNPTPMTTFVPSSPHVLRVWVPGRAIRGSLGSAQGTPRYWAQGVPVCVRLTNLQNKPPHKGRLVCCPMPLMKSFPCRTALF